MPLLDLTWSALCIKSSEHRYFLCPGPGGSYSAKGCANPLQATLHFSMDESLCSTLEIAKKTFPHFEWNYAGIRASTFAFPPNIIEDTINADIRTRALRKLSPEERKALGV